MPLQVSYKDQPRPRWWPLKDWGSRAMDKRAELERVYEELQKLRARAARQAPDK